MSKNEYNLRQFNLMQKVIAEYETGTSTLGILVSSLEALRFALEDEDVFVDKFEPLWGKLEDIYAVMLDEERLFPDSTDNTILNNSLSKIKILIDANVSR